MLVGVVFVAGCVSQSGDGGRGQRFQNFSGVERQQLLGQFREAAVSACVGGTEGVACEVVFSRGSRSGSCKLQDGVLLCVSGFERRNSSQSGGQSPQPG